MPKIKWRDLPPDLLSHLFDRAKERDISMEDLFALEEWRKHSPAAPNARNDRGNEAAGRILAGARNGRFEPDHDGVKGRKKLRRQGPQRAMP